MIPVIILIIVFVLIAVRQIGNIRLKIWQIMLGGALAVLLTGQISPSGALKALNVDVMLFLFGAFVIGQALEESGYLSHLAYRMFRRAGSLKSLVFYILFGMGLLSALLMNDTIAIIGTPVVLSLAKKANTQPKILLLALAFAITIGSATSPIGNPQNLLIALHDGVINPFVTFLRYLLVPTLLNLLAAYLLLWLFYRRHFHSKPVIHTPELIRDLLLARLSKISLIMLVILILAKIATVLAGLKIDFRLTYIALTAALPILIFTPKRPGVLKRIDWYTLIFFAAMFVLMQSVWDTEIFQSAIAATSLDITTTGMVMTISVLLSQLISNVPLVALYIPVLTHAGATTLSMMALAAGSTIAGNLSILGAASNIIIIQNAEKRGGATLTFFEFARIGLPLTAINLLVYWLFFQIF